jgi:glucose-1-phosphate thymidylyltransferase
MIAVFLCAGHATRLYPLTKTFPKPLLSVADKPVIDYLVDQVAPLPSIETLHVITNAKFYRHFRLWAEQKSTSTAGGIDIVIHDDGTTNNETRLGAVADLHFVLQKIASPGPMLVAAADNIFRFSIAPVWKRFLNEKKHLVLALPQKDHRQLQKTGVLELNTQDRVIRLHEKPDHPPSTWSCPPLYLLQPSAQKHLHDLVSSGDRPDAPGHFIDYLCQREYVAAHKVNSSRLDIGDIHSYRSADLILRTEPLFNL